MTPIRLSLVLTLSVAFLAACSDSSDAPGPGAAQAAVRLDASGDIVLAVEGRELFAMPGQAPVYARNFEETASGIGVVSFQRSDEELDALFSQTVETVGNGLTVVYANASDTRSAILEAVPESATTTRFSLSFSGAQADSLAVPVRCDSGGTFHGESRFDIPGGEEIVLKAAVDIDTEAGGIHIDFAGSSGASPHGVNVVLNYTHAYATFALRSTLDPELPNNHGSISPITDLS